MRTFVQSLSKPLKTFSTSTHFTLQDMSFDNAAIPHFFYEITLKQSTTTFPKKFH